MSQEQVYNPKVQKVSVTIEGKPNQLYAQGMQSFEQYDEICKYSTGWKQRDNNNLQLHDLSMGEYSEYLEWSIYFCQVLGKW